MVRLTVRVIVGLTVKIMVRLKVKLMDHLPTNLVEVSVKTIDSLGILRWAVRGKVEILSLLL